LRDSYFLSNPKIHLYLSGFGSAKAKHAVNIMDAFHCGAPEVGLVSVPFQKHKIELAQ
jgi:hypothetical protein